MRFCPRCDYEDPICWHSYRWITEDDREHLLRLLKDVKVRKAVRAIVSERETSQPITFPGRTQEEVENIKKEKKEGQVGNDKVA